MRTTELYEILDDENKKLPIGRLKEIIYKLRHDCCKEYNSLFEKCETSNMSKEDYILMGGYYTGEDCAFRIMLMILEHLEEKNNETEIRAYSMGHIRLEPCSTKGIRLGRAVVHNG